MTVAGTTRPPCFQNYRRRQIVFIDVSISAVALLVPNILYRRAGKRDSVGTREVVPIVVLYFLFGVVNDDPQITWVALTISGGADSLE